MTEAFAPPVEVAPRPEWSPPQLNRLRGNESIASGFGTGEDAEGNPTIS